jgi:hypothetical protein
MRLEHATQFTDRPRHSPRIGRIGRELEMIAAGARTCHYCGYRSAVRGLGDGDGGLVPICAPCTEDKGMDRQVEHQRAARAAMRRHR